MNTLHLLLHQHTNKTSKRRYTNQNLFFADISQFYYTFAAGSYEKSVIYWK